MLRITLHQQELQQIDEKHIAHQRMIRLLLLLTCMSSIVLFAQDSLRIFAFIRHKLTQTSEVRSCAVSNQSALCAHRFYDNF